ncbi:Spy/CpxP family protein refolding chaperone [Lutimaribacter saemankumensis]|uniref:LTXXQ motif family protein n=1 Tax=Lutimaribacter saemankumensis TaxID=490829 RepID=A0A1G8N8F7_9RHOB|nr:Spy/CpxP family protein refolding chaperone [Lutimaribacter saemankumensis]SDI76403.1 LTXXQ motif family protein [Lutimaribacter saemankumensis]
MRKSIRRLIAVTIAGFGIGAGPFAALAEKAPYAGMDARDIASLSQEDVDAILAGRGWGLALPAELGGYPGPLHILELADDLNLSDTQRAEVQAVYDAMKADAQKAGSAYVEAEAMLSHMFRMGHADPQRLELMLKRSSDALAELRAVHLRAHLTVTPMLTEDQKEIYARERGYAGGHGHAGHGGHANH